MRLLIFLLALSSAFFVPNVFSSEPDMSDLVGPKGTEKDTLLCTLLNGSPVLSLQVAKGTPTSLIIPYCVEYALQNLAKPTDVQGCAPDDPTIEINGGHVRMTQSIYKPWYWQDGSFGGCANDTANNHNLYAASGEPFESEECPPDSSAEHTIPVDIEGQMMCAKPKPEVPPFSCPEPTGNELLQFSTQSNAEICFDNGDTSQCKITTNDDGTYMLPPKYGSQEPVICKEQPPKPYEPPTPTIPEDTPDPEPTPTPDPKEPNEDADPTESANDLDALNKINENLDTINSNINTNSDSNDDRLEAIFSETQNSNELLASIKDNTYATGLNASELLMELSYSNGLLQGILDKPVGGGGGNGNGDDEGEEEETFTIKVERKNAEKGLKSIFTDEQRQVITDEIDEKKQEIEDYFEQIESESSSLFDINPSLGGGYEERMVVIKGVEVDMGLGRLSSFFQLIAAAVMLCSTLTALYILLGP